jgi:hypothetical protein
MKRASYRNAVAWIALNDETTEIDPQEIRGFISVVLVADLFDVDALKVASDVVRYRMKQCNEAERHIGEN